MKNIIVYSILLSLLLSCKENRRPIPELNIQQLLDDQFELMNDAPGYLIDDFGAILLDSTDYKHPEDIGKITAFRNDLYLLVKHALRRYDMLSGRLEQCYCSDRKFSSFDIDTLHKRIYALDTVVSELVCINFDGTEISSMSLDKQYTYTDVSCLDTRKLLLTTDAFPEPVVFQCQFQKSVIPLFPLKKKEKYGLLADSLACTLAVIGHGTNCVYYKYLLNDTLYQLKGDSCVPFFCCNLGKDAVRIKDKQLGLKENDRACITGLWETEEHWWIQHRRSLDFKGKTYRFTTLGVLDKELNCEIGGFIFYIPGQKIYLNSRKTLYMDKEGTRFIQVYNEADMKNEKREFPYNLQEVSNKDVVLLNYFYMDKPKRKKV